MSVREKLQARAALIADMRKVIDTAEKEKRDMTSDEAAKYDAMEADVSRIEASIEVMKRQEALESTLAVVEEPSFRMRPSVYDAGTPVNPRASKEYAHGFDRYCRVGRNGLDHRVLASLNVGTDADGGYVVPEEFETMLVKALQDINEIRRYAKVVVTAGDRHIPIEASLGTAAWTAEEAPYVESDAQFDRVTLGAHKLGTIIKVSEELLQDSFFDMPSYLAENFGKRFGLAEEAAFINGNGSGKPTGIIQGSTEGVVAASATAITSDELIDLYHALERPYRSGATWVMNDSTIKIVRKLKDADDQYLWQPGLQAGEPDRILSRPVVASAAMPAAAISAKSVLFGDLSYYCIADRRGMVVQRLNELYAANGQVGFRAYKRTDGKVTLGVAIKHMVMAGA